MNGNNYPLSFQIPLSVAQQNAITPGQLAKLIVELLIRNDKWQNGTERRYISYYAFQLSSLRAFEIVGHANPEEPGFRRKWSEAIAILRSKALIMLDPSQMDSDDFMLPTSIAYKSDLDEVLGLTA